MAEPKWNGDETKPSYLEEVCKLHYVKSDYRQISSFFSMHNLCFWGEPE